MNIHALEQLTGVCSYQSSENGRERCSQFRLPKLGLPAVVIFLCLRTSLDIEVLDTKEILCA